MRSHPKRLLLSHPDIQQHRFCFRIFQDAKNTNQIQNIYKYKYIQQLLQLVFRFSEMQKKYKAPSTFCPCNHDPLDLSNLVVYISKFILVTTFSSPLSISWLQISQNPAVTGWHQLQQKWISLGTEEVFAGVRDRVGVLAGV